MYLVGLWGYNIFASSISMCQPSASLLTGGIKYRSWPSAAPWTWACTHRERRRMALTGGSQAATADPGDGGPPPGIHVDLVPGGHGKLLLWSPYPLRVKTSISSCSFSCRIGLGAPVPWWPLMALLAEIGFGARTRTYCTILCVQFCWLLLGCAEAQVICKHD
jgi:hypothetical protein